MEIINEEVHKERVQREIRDGNQKIHRHLHMHTVRFRILERPELLKQKTDEKGYDKRPDGGPKVVNKEKVGKNIQQPEVNHGRGSSGDEVAKKTLIPSDIRQSGRAYLSRENNNLFFPCTQMVNH